MQALKTVFFSHLANPPARPRRHGRKSQFCFTRRTHRGRSGLGAQAEPSWHVDFIPSNDPMSIPNLPFSRIQQVFDRFDKDGGGSLDRTELQLLGQCWEFYQSIGNVTWDMWVSLGVLLFHKKNPSLFIVQCHEIWSQVCIQDVVSIFQLQTNHSVRTWTWQRRGGMHGGIGQLHHRGSQWRHTKKSPHFQLFRNRQIGKQDCLQVRGSLLCCFPLLQPWSLLLFLAS